MEPIVLKGNREGIVICLDCSINFRELCIMLIEKIKKADNFFGGNSEVIVNSGNTTLEEEKAQQLINILSSQGLTIKKFIPEIRVKEEALKVVSIPQHNLDCTHFLADGPSLIIKKNIRSGQTIEYAGTVILFGDVNPGGEIIASGHILIIGHLRGVAHAGAKGNEQAVVFATCLQPTQLRIGNYIARAPDGELINPDDPEIARIKEGKVVIEKYSHK